MPTRIVPFLLTAASLFWADLAFSQQKQKPDSIDLKLTQCLDKQENQSTAGMCNCTYAALEEWDKKLNSTYKALLTQVDAVGKTKLMAAQRQWVVFKEKEIELIDATYGKAQGTMWQVVRANKVMDITRQRARALEELLTTLKEI
ncbi:lysozyme inhibitor LprI family protein [Rufibacter latericius]|uniref:DUF1311 domain-containing protein n=1 Tax=Rufibacter latericius TaxID=2487040 RepID=A0A3M9MML0_9BACT|nr:lysozyme inhibitor LprI family protein [Rufibacter latericius]RNI26776.1 DUF1311 domain-containing protein [Rufibacter latericius]